MVQDKSLQLIYLNKEQHPMLVISRLQPGNSESKWVGEVILYPRWSTFSCLQDTGACFIFFSIPLIITPCVIISGMEKKKKNMKQAPVS